LGIVAAANPGFGQVQLAFYMTQHFVIDAAFITQPDGGLVFDAQRPNLSALYRACSGPSSSSPD